MSAYWEAGNYRGESGHVSRLQAPVYEEYNVITQLGHT